MTIRRSSSRPAGASPTKTRSGRPRGRRRSSGPIRGGSGRSSSSSSGWRCAALEKNAQVMAIVSAGQQQVEVPRLIGSTATAAEQLLQSQGLSANKRTVDSTKAKGIVVAQDPPEGTKVAKGTTVGVAVSSGPGQVKVPSVQGMSTTDAVETITKAGL